MMIRKLAFLGVLTSVISTAGCGNQLNSVKMKPSAGSDGPGSQGAEKGLPNLKSENRVSLVFNELNRVQRLLRTTSAIPDAREKSCAVYDPTPTDRGIFLVVKYQGCNWSQAIGEKNQAVDFGLSGSELYEKFADHVEVSSKNISLRITPKGSKSTGPDHVYAHKLSIKGDDGIGKVRTVNFASSLGTSATPTEPYWLTKVESGEWLQTGKSDFKMLKGTSVTWTFRPASGDKKKAAAAAELLLSATSDIEFHARCPWPVRGSFLLRDLSRDSKETSLAITVDESGFTTKNGVEVRWPNHCLGIGL